MNDQAAWAVTYQPSSGAFRFLHTTSGGARWTVVTPSHPVSGSVFAGMWDFLDLDHGWLLYSQGHTPGDYIKPHAVVLMATTDGGRRWQETGALPTTCYPDDTHPVVSVYFVDASNGWCDSRFGDVAAPVFATANGGWTWRRIGLPSAMTAEIGSARRPVCSFQVRFTTPAHGWTTMQCPGQPTALFQTRDGGADWSRLAIPAPTGSTLADLAIDGLPIGTGHRFAFGASTNVRDHRRFFVYRSFDVGRSWRVIEVPRPSRYWAFALIDAEHWRLVSDDHILATDDAGHTWHTIHADQALTILGQSHAEPGQSTFTSTRVAWFTTGGEDQTLTRSIDDGRTWAVRRVLGVTRSA